MTILSESELIINPDGSIYHLNLRPDQIADTIITVGDQDRVAQVSRYFDTIEHKAQHREFVTHTGTYNGKRLSVISTGIGTDNIDIVLNELDALANIDFETRKIKDTHRQLSLIRVGTSGAVRPEIPVDGLLASSMAIGFDNLPYFYSDTDFFDDTFSDAFVKYTGWSAAKSKPYVVSADPQLMEIFSSSELLTGVTATNVGFYGPQGRVLRLGLEDAELNDKITSFSYNGVYITNMEMETAGMYAMARMLGHRAISLNAILANRPNGTFSGDPTATVDRLIQLTLSLLSQ